MKIPPQDLTAEEAVLGSLLLEHIDEAFEKLKAEDFYKPLHQDIFDAMVKTLMAGESVDIVSVGKRLDIADNVLPDLTRQSESRSFVIKYIDIIKEQSIKRTLIKYCSEIQDECYNNGDAYPLLEKAQEMMFSLESSDTDTLYDIHDTLQAVSKHIMTIQESGEPIGLKTGLDLDDILQGFQDAKLYIIGARPSMGKTALVMTAMRKIAEKGKGTGIISLETSHQSLGIRLVSQSSGIPAEVISSGRMNGDQVQKFMKACEKLSAHNILIDDGSGVSAMQLRGKCIKMKRKGCDIIFIDFLTLITAEGRSKHEEVGKITKMCKQIAKELSIPVVMLSQLSRKVEDRSIKRPQLSDLRESGSIEEDADAILFLYRPEYYGVIEDESGSTKGVAEVIVAKNKDGRTGIKRQLWEAETMTFKNIAQQEKAPF